MLPVVAGTAETKRQILIYCVLLVPISILPWALGFAGAIYAATAGMSGATIILLAIQLYRSDGTQKRPAPRLFAFSILYLFVLFAAISGCRGDPQSTRLGHSYAMRYSPRTHGRPSRPPFRAPR